MMRAWIGLALLGCSWLLGLGYYRPASWIAWSVVVVLGSLLLAGAPLRLPGRRESGWAVALLVPAVWWMPWPYRAAPLAIAAGLVLHAAPIPRRWPAPLGRGAVSAGLVLLVQSLALWAYECRTAQSHELPWPLPDLLGAVTGLLGLDVAVDGTALAVSTLREVQRVGATWELLLDPATLAFLVGGLALLGCTATSLLPPGERWMGWLRAARMLTLGVVVWMPLRAGLLIALLAHRVVRSDGTARLNLMDQFFSPWVNLGLLAAPVLLAWWWVPAPRGDPPGTPESTAAATGRHRKGWYYPASLAAVLAAAAVFATAFYWRPAGRKLEGRVKVVERHSTWEPTSPSYDTTHFGEDASYTYAAIYDYCSGFYAMSRLPESQEIDDQGLSACDVLVIKTPTAPYSSEEIKAIHRFVERGGGLLLIGEHTNFKTSTSILNGITEHFGFKYRHDLLFSIGDPYNQWYEPPAVPHPVVQHVPRMAFAVSCSIDPGNSPGEAVIRSTGLWSLPPNYRVSNWFPEAEYRADMRYGAFIQLWATTSGRGRVLAWTDSTIFSNFCTFQPGKAEMMLGMLQWLNRRSIMDRAWVRWTFRGVLGLMGLALLAVGWYWAQRGCTPGLLLLAAALLGWSAASAAVACVHRTAMPPPEPADSMFRVVIDRTVSDVPLALGAYNEDKEGAGYGLLEQWIPRLGYFTMRRTGREAFGGQMLVVICPRRSVSREFREGLQRYVAGGGRLLVIDSPDSAGSTANSLLWPFGLAVSHADSREGELALSRGGPGIPVSAACRVSGGTPLAWVGDMPVAARTAYDGGAVMAIGFGSALNDAALGFNWMAEPDVDALTRSDLLFALVRALATGRPIIQPSPRSTASPKEGAK